MSKRPKTSLNQIGRSLKHATPTILTVVGAVGMVATVILAVKATPKAVEAVKADSRKNHDGDPHASTKSEAVKSAWKYYVPTAITGAATLMCIFGANALNRRQQASLTSAYALLNRSYADYKRKLKELYGDEAHDKVVEALAVEKSNAPQLYSYNLTSRVDTAFEDASEEEYLFYDRFGERYFHGTVGQVLQAEYHLNRNFCLRGYAGYNEFCEFLGIEPKKDLENFAWWVDDDFYWIDFDHSKAMIDDGINGEVPCYIIDTPFAPSDTPPD